MPYFRTPDGCRLFFEFHTNDRINHSPVIVFLNGFTQSTLQWKYQVDEFKDAYPVLTYDARSQGNSDSGNFPLTLGQHTQDLADLLAFLQIKNAHFIGISLGAKISLSFAEYCPRKVNSLILCSIGMETSDHTRQTFQTAKRILENEGITRMAEYLLPFFSGSFYLRKNKKTHSAMAKAIAKRNKQESLLAQLAAMQTYPGVSAMDFSFKIPMLVISGTEDRLINDTAIEHLATYLGAEWEQIQDAGHSIPLEAPDIFNRIILRFITP